MIELLTGVTLSLFALSLVLCSRAAYLRGKREGHNDGLVAGWDAAARVIQARLLEQGVLLHIMDEQRDDGRPN